jgi:predicted nucleotidyltransferase
MVRPPPRAAAPGTEDIGTPGLQVEDGGVTGPEVSRVLADHGVAVAYLFGSRAKGTARPDSDHDVAVLFAAADPPLDATVRLAADLGPVLGTSVDVVDLDLATLELRGTVADSGRLLYSSDEIRRVRFEVEARMRWIEFRPVLQTTTREYLRRVAQHGLR